MEAKHEALFLSEMMDLWTVFHPTRDMPANQVRVYWGVLSGYSFERVRAGMRSIIQSQSRSVFPPPAAIIEHMPAREEQAALTDNSPGITYAEYVANGGRPFTNKKTHDMLMARPAERIKEKAAEKRKQVGYKTTPTQIGAAIGKALTGE